MRSSFLPHDLSHRQWLMSGRVFAAVLVDLIDKKESIWRILWQERQRQASAMCG